MQVQLGFAAEAAARAKLESDAHAAALALAAALQTRLLSIAASKQTMRMEEHLGASDHGGAGDKTRTRVSHAFTTKPSNGSSPLLLADPPRPTIATLLLGSSKEEDVSQTRQVPRFVMAPDSISCVDAGRNSDGLKSMHRCRGSREDGRSERQFISFADFRHIRTMERRAQLENLCDEDVVMVCLSFRCSCSISLSLSLP